MRTQSDDDVLAVFGGPPPEFLSVRMRAPTMVIMIDRRDVIPEPLHLTPYELTLVRGPTRRKFQKEKRSRPNQKRQRRMRRRQRHSRT